MVALAVAAMLPAASEAEFFACCRLHRDARDVHPGDLGNAERITSRIGPILGRSQISVTSRLAMRPPRAVTRSTAYFRKRSEAAPFHCASLGGKCEPISPSASAPRMASTSACRPTSPSEWARKPRVRHAHPADHQMIAVAEGVHVVAGAGPDIAEPAGKPGLLAGKIFRCGEFHIRRIAFKRRYRQSRPFRNRCIVGEIAAPLTRGAAMSLEDLIKTKACGVCAMRSRARSGVASTSPLAFVSLMVSVTGIAGTAAPVRPAASIAREISADVTKAAPRHGSGRCRACPR
jgi:hypothetical protein